MVGCGLRIMIRGFWRVKGLCEEEKKGEWMRRDGEERVVECGSMWICGDRLCGIGS